MIYRAIGDLSEKSMPYDAVTLGEWFQSQNLAEMVGGASYVIELANSTPSAANITAYADIVREKSVLRQLIDAGTEIAGDAFVPEGRSSQELLEAPSRKSSTSPKPARAGWVSFGSDASSMSPEGVFMKTSTHPSAYGNFARLLGKYVRDEHVIPMEEADSQADALPADTLRIKDRGRLAIGLFRRCRRFDPKTIADKATYEQPHQYAVGMKHVWVNGGQVLKDGEHTGQKPGRVVRGPGWRAKT